MPRIHHGVFDCVGFSGQKLNTNDSHRIAMLEIVIRFKVRYEESAYLG